MVIELLASKECSQGFHKTLHVSKFAREELAAALNLHVFCDYILYVGTTAEESVENVYKWVDEVIKRALNVWNIGAFQA